MKNFSAKTAYPWDVLPQAAIALQTPLSRRVIRKGRIQPHEIASVAGVDTAYRQNVACAAVVVFSLADLKVMQEEAAAHPARFPYIPGLLAFRAFVVKKYHLFINSSISSASRGMVFVKSTGPLGEMRISFSMRTPMASSRI